MLLTTPVSNEWLSVSATALTVVEPGQIAALSLVMTALQPVTVSDLHWELPEGLSVEPDPGSEILPYTFNAGDTYEAVLNIRTKSGEEGYGEIGIQLMLESETEDIPPLQWKFWLSVFERKSAVGETALSDELRKRLVDVVNSRDRNGHIFLADFGAFFDDYLNVEISAAIAKLVALDMGLPDEGLPLDRETYILISLGEKTFYGIVKLELIYEEFCVESDDRFDPDDTREVAFLDLENA